LTGASPCRAGWCRSASIFMDEPVDLVTEHQAAKVIAEVLMQERYYEPVVANAIGLRCITELVKRGYRIVEDGE
jgi:hypothetical protein